MGGNYLFCYVMREIWVNELLVFMAVKKCF